MDGNVEDRVNINMKVERFLHLNPVWHLHQPDLDEGGDSWLLHS